MDWRLERLCADHALRKFRSGEHSLDLYLKRHALANDERGLGSTYLAVEAERVLGYVTLCASAVHFEHVPADGLPCYPIPVILIARLAVEQSAQGRGIGTGLVVAALGLAEEVAEQLGVFAVTVYALTPQASTFYRKRFGFTELLDDPLHLFLTIADLRASGI